MRNPAEQISRIIDREAEFIVRTLADLVAINTVNPYAGGTVTGKEKPGQLYLEPLFRDLGGEVTFSGVPQDVYRRSGVIGPQNRDFTDRPNLVAQFEFGAPGPHVLVFAHMDTVDVGGMTAPPFKPIRRHGKVFGRGASDDKSGLAVAYHATAALLEAGFPLCGRLTVASVVDEECNGGGAGILALLLAGVRPDVAVCLDGSAAFLGRGCAGVVTGHIDVPGVAAHAASPEGISALEKGLKLKAALDTWKARREAERPKGLLNLGVFRAGVHPAVVPGAGEMEFNLVYFLDEARHSEQAGTGFGAAPLREQIEERVGETARKDDFLAEHPPRLTWIKDLPPFETPADCDLVRETTEAYRIVTGDSPSWDVMNGWSDASHVPLLADAPVVNLGSAAEGAPHSPGEFVEEATLIRNAKVLALLLARVLSQE